MNPARDVAYAMGSYLERAIMLFKHPNAWYMDWYFNNGGTVEELDALIDSWSKYAQAVAGTAEGEINTIRDAFIHARFFELKRETQLLGFAVLGMTLQSAYFSGYRDATTVSGIGAAFNNPVDLLPMTYSTRSRIRRGIRAILFWALRKI